jgi:hypothetical protein
VRGHQLGDLGPNPAAGSGTNCYAPLEHAHP